MRKFAKTLSLLWSLMLLPFAHSAAQNKVYKSPLAAMQAIVIPVGKKRFEHRESRVEIHAGERTLRWRSFASSDGSHGEGIDHAAWTINGQFFVFNTSSSGGHQPWHLPMYFYSRSTNRFYGLDSSIGPVTSDFSLVGRSTLKTTRFNLARKNGKESVTVNLRRLLSKTRGRH